MSPKSKSPPDSAPPERDAGLRPKEGPRARDPERTRARLLDAAEEEFGARGFHGARVRAIVEAAGVNERMLYHYFGDKEGLYRALIERDLGRTSEAVRRATSDADFGDVPSLLERTLRVFAEALTAQPSFARLVLHEALNDFKSFPKLEAEPGDPLIAQLHPLWEAAAERGELRSDADPRVTFAMGAMLAILWPVVVPRLQRLFPERRLDTAESMEWARDQIARTLLHGVLGEGARTKKESPKAARKR